MIFFTGQFIRGSAFSLSAPATTKRPASSSGKGANKKAGNSKRSQTEQYTFFFQESLRTPEKSQCSIQKRRPFYRIIHQC
ncbi:hypothetical protein glysoja_030769 [Glycine soja]|uniref:Uncharacterized protein n=1 Tax=Glycine soja TaxID=3848 RepID=A0A0B2NT98_GLYSO|nr:hypothetical protein glysoja_030769 [Glycine soja]